MATITKLKKGNKMSIIIVISIILIPVLLNESVNEEGKK
jgi:hypothetical protein|tara:strand:+ start:311 stop:427 length:117 start_codon:yes stop_codon:yes gene_type:complete